MIKAIPTIRVKLLENSKIMIINETDFNPVYHEIVASDPEIPSAIDTYRKNKKEGASSRKKLLVDTTKKNKVKKVAVRRRAKLA